MNQTEVACRYFMSYYKINPIKNILSETYPHLLAKETEAKRLNKLNRVT